MSQNLHVGEWICILGPQVPGWHALQMSAISTNNWTPIQASSQGKGRRQSHAGLQERWNFLETWGLALPPFSFPGALKPILQPLVSHSHWAILQMPMRTPLGLAPQS